VKAPRTQSLRREFAGAPIGESRLKYLPLGGLGEVGINMWALEWQNQVLVVDAGLMFPQEDMLGIDLVLPDITYLLEKGRKVLGIFLSHGHEDHIGGLPFALKKLNVPVYGTRLTLGLVKPTSERSGWAIACSWVRFVSRRWPSATRFPTRSRWRYRPRSVA
jgi:mRNA degradation ribonuclease J1/J2